MLMAAPGVGAVIAVLTLASLANRLKRQGLFLVGSIVILGFFLIVFSQIRVFSLALVSLVIAGAFQMFFLASTATILQLLVPDELRGRVMTAPARWSERSRKDIFDGYAALYYVRQR